VGFEEELEGLLKKLGGESQYTGMFLCFCDFVVVVFRMLFCVKSSCFMAVLFFRDTTCSPGKGCSRTH
jgi:hypothetical protein